MRTYSLSREGASCTPLAGAASSSNEEREHEPATNSQSRHGTCHNHRRRRTNQLISARAPSDYLAEIRDTPGFPFGQVLISHGLPADAESPLLCDDYEAFLALRQEHLWQEIRRVTGATVAADLEADDKDLE